MLADKALRARIATGAWQAVHRYLAEGQFVRDMGFLFTGARPVAEPAQVEGVPALGLQSSRGGAT